MLKKYKNQLPQFLEQHGFRGTQFKFTENKETSTLNYLGSPMTFYFHQTKTRFDTFTFGYSRFDPAFSNVSHQSTALLFDAILTQLQKWLSGPLKEYIDETEGPDKLMDWINAGQEFKKIQEIDFDSIDNFTEEEEARLKIGLIEIKELIISKFQFNNEQLNILTERFQYLEESIDRTQTKTDWKNIFIATLINIVTTVTFDPNMRQFIIHAFTEFFNGLGALKNILGT